MSFANNRSLFSWVSSLPSSLISLNVNNSPIGSLTPLPISCSIISASNASLTITGMDNICSQSYSNGQVSGSINILGNGPADPSTVATYINNLIAFRGWKILYDP